MSSLNFSELDSVLTREGAEGLFNKLEQEFQFKQDYHNLFDIKMMRKKYEMGLPIGSPTLFKDVTQIHRKEFEEYYTHEARETGNKYLAINKIPDAWLYFRILGDNTPIFHALDKTDLPRDFTEEADELIRLALYQKVHPVKGLHMMLVTSGMCNTITACDQFFHELSIEQRQGITKILVNEMYHELVNVLTREIRKKVPLLPPGINSLVDLITGREWLFEDDNYHVDASHLNAVVRFSRSLTKDHPELELARQLAHYGSCLSPSLQYCGEVPFAEYYPAHLAYFDIVLERNVNEGCAYFENQLADEPDLMDKQLVAFVLVDLYVRLHKIGYATRLAVEYLADVKEESGFSIKDFCIQHRQYDALKNYAINKNDAFLYTTALLEDQRG